jgi:hypothetical protein
MTIYKCLSHQMLRNSCVKFINLFSGTLYIVLELKYVVFQCSQFCGRCHERFHRCDGFAAKKYFGRCQFILQNVSIYNT